MKSGPLVALHVVFTNVAEHEVRVTLAAHAVVALASEHQIRPTATQHAVVAAVSEHKIGACQAAHPIVSGSGNHHVRPGVPDKQVVEGGPDDERSARDNQQREGAATTTETCDPAFGIDAGSSAPEAIDDVVNGGDQRLEIGNERVGLSNNTVRRRGVIVGAQDQRICQSDQFGFDVRDKRVARPDEL
jgi:hypothetical protein